MEHEALPFSAPKSTATLEIMELLEHTPKTRIPMPQIVFHNSWNTAPFFGTHGGTKKRFWTFKNNSPNFCKWNTVTASYSPYS